MSGIRKEENWAERHSETNRTIPQKRLGSFRSIDLSDGSGTSQLCSIFHTWVTSLKKTNNNPKQDDQFLSVHNEQSSKFCTCDHGPQVCPFFNNFFSSANIKSSVQLPRLLSCSSLPAQARGLKLQGLQTSGNRNCQRVC